jgi:inositol phosphorylceramide mannosyltransferase catalytic subunit
MIPKLIHQTAKTADIPEKWRAYQKRLRDLHPDWEYKLWTDVDNLAFVKAEFPDFLDIFVALPKNIMRADVIRYLLMYRLGGFYLDLDYEMLKPFDLTHHECVLPWEGDELGPDKDNICNAIFASAPGHPFFKMVIDELKANPPLDPSSDPLNTTGPAFISRIFHQVPRDEWNIHTPARVLFSPKTPRNPREYRAILRSGASYGIHHCHGTWRQYSFGRKILYGIKGVVRQFI